MEPSRKASDPFDYRSKSFINDNSNSRTDWINHRCNNFPTGAAGFGQSRQRINQFDVTKQTPETRYLGRYQQGENLSETASGEFGDGTMGGVTRFESVASQCGRNQERYHLQCKRSSINILSEGPRSPTRKPIRTVSDESSRGGSGIGYVVERGWSSSSCEQDDEENDQKPAAILT
jgi:hypothetical protein